MSISEKTASPISDRADLCIRQAIKFSALQPRMAATWNVKLLREHMAADKATPEMIKWATWTIQNLKDQHGLK